ncbi:MAG: hypothetical protein V1905_00655 [bacterium]
MFSKHKKWGIPLFLIILFFGIFFYTSHGDNLIQASTTSEEPIKIPESSDDFKNAGNNFMTAFPEGLNNAWKEALSFWGKAGDRLKEFWDQTVSGRIGRLIDWFNALIGKEKAIREPIIKEDFEKEKTEMKDSINKDLPPITKSVWDKLRELFSR